MGLHTRTDLLNYLIERYGLKSYLEIGVQGRVNFDKVKLPAHAKFGVDPDPVSGADYIGTSDEYFSDTSFMPRDLILIDGLHTAEQVKRDFDNALRCLTNKGFIVLHDCLPTEERYTTVPRETKIWYGDVYKFAMSLAGYGGIGYATWSRDCGCCVVWKSNEEPECMFGKEFTWQDYIKYKSLLNIVDDITKYLP